TLGIHILPDGRIGVGTISPTERMHVAGNVLATGQLKSSVAAGTAPLNVISTTLVPNLNPELHNGWRHYKSLAELGLTASATLAEIYNAMPNYSTLDVDAVNFSFKPHTSAIDARYTFTKYTFKLVAESWRVSGRYFYGYMTGTGSEQWTGWKTVGVADGTVQ